MIGALMASISEYRVWAIACSPCKSPSVSLFVKQNLARSCLSSRAMITTKFSLSLAFFFYDKINLFKILEILFPFKKQNASSYTDQRSLERESYSEKDMSHLP